MIHDKANFSRIVNESFRDAVLNAVNTDQVFPVYHYTSTDGLIGILTTNEIWLGNVDDLNDLTEMNYGFEKIILPAINESSIISEETKQKLRELIVLARNKNFSVSKGNDAYKCNVNIYVFSTSKNGNAYTLWSNYTKNNNKAGYAISMNNTDVTQAIMSALNARKERQQSDINSFLFCGKIIYSKKKQIDLVNDYLTIFAYNLEDRPDEFEEIESNAFVEGLLILSLFMKDEEFSKEDEFRYIVLLADEITDTNSRYKPYLKFINVNGNIMSRLVMPFDSSFIKEIVVSPYISDQDKVEQQLSFFARKCGRPKITIQTNVSKKIR